VSILCCEQIELGQPKVDSGNLALDNDEVSLRLKTFVEKLDAEKTELANRLHEEQRYVGYFDTEQGIAWKNDMHPLMAV